jgi:catechol 2,3-dioxygenase-like lactoylglutathione lyase family enzyme
MNEKENNMSLSTYKVRTSIAVSDMANAADFYEGKLGLIVGEDQSDESRIYMCGGDTSLHIYESPAHAGKATATLATWHVADLKHVVDELGFKGVTFERYDGRSLSPERRPTGIFSHGCFRVEARAATRQDTRPVRTTSRRLAYWCRQAIVRRRLPSALLTGEAEVASPPCRSASR